MLTGKIAVVTGGAMGIGKQVALAYARYGADVVIFDINKPLADETAKEIEELGRKSEAVFVDVASCESVKTAVAETIEKWGRIDILANCAGINIAGKFLEITEQNYEKMMNINLKGMMFVTQEIAKHMKQNKYGRVVNIASMVGKMAEAGNGGYCMTKAAVIMQTKVAALELARDGITLNAVCPGYVDTALMQEVFVKRAPVLGLTPAEFEQQILDTIPLGRMAQPSEIADLMAFLSSDRAAYITGVAITIAGGVYFE